MRGPKVTDASADHARANNGASTEPDAVADARADDSPHSHTFALAHAVAHDRADGLSDISTFTYMRGWHVPRC